MGRRLGSKDKKKRKTSGYKRRWREFHKKHKRRNRKTKSGKYVNYKSRNKGDPIKAWYWEVRPMNRDSVFNWNQKIRPKVRKIIYKPFLRVDLEPNDISNKDKLANTSLRVLGCDGEFVLKLWSPARNRYGCSARMVARIIIRDTPTGLKCFILEHYKLSRYFFWEKE